MSQQHIKDYFWLDLWEWLHESVCKINVCLQWHLESEAIGKVQCLFDGPKSTCIFLGYETVRVQPQVPEFDEERLDGLYLEYFSEGKACEGDTIFHINNFINVGDTYISMNG